ncbi:hypothetical protein V6L77_15540 [Pannonibacter sp. Pt2-lr]
MKSETDDFFRTCEVEAEELLDQLGRIATALWIYDFDLKRILWANASGLEVWGASSLEQLRSRDLSSDMSRTVAERLNQYKADFQRSDATFTETWTLYPLGVPKTLQVIFRGTRLKDGRTGMLCEGIVNHEIRPETLRSAEALLHTPVMISCTPAMVLRFTVIPPHAPRRSKPS